MIILNPSLLTPVSEPEENERNQNVVVKWIFGRGHGRCSSSGRGGGCERGRSGAAAAVVAAVAAGSKATRGMIDCTF